MATRLDEDGPLSTEEFLALMENEATKLERFARELREGKWERYNIQENFDRDDGGPGQERATITVQASRLQAYGACRTVMTDGEESPPTRAHEFEGSWQPHPEKRGIEHERYEVTCTGCGLTIINPTDAYPVDHCPAVEALTPEWLELMSYPKECVPRASEHRAHEGVAPTL